jgi:hypothetical protein
MTNHTETLQICNGALVKEDDRDLLQRITAKLARQAGLGKRSPGA